MNNFLEHFGKFLWIWKGFAIYLIVTGLVWLFLIFYMESGKSKENNKEDKDVEEVEQDDDLF